MRSLRTLAPLAVALGLIVAAPAAGGAVQNGGPPVEAAGDGAAPLIPSIVNTRIVRAQAALRRASRHADRRQPAKLVGALNSARAQARYAWNAANYVIRTTPPSPAGDALPDGTEAAAGAYAGREDTAFAALSLQHDVVATTVGLMTQVDAKTKALRTSLINAISSSQAVRNRAVAFIHTRKLPGTFPTVMPNLVPLANDEVRELNGRMKMTGFAGTLRKSLLKSRLRAVKTRKLVNKYWPPAPAD
jgi:hypothetical protein